MPVENIIVVGASAGGVEALQQFVGDLSPDITAAVVIVLHTSPQAPSLMPKILNRTSAQLTIDPQEGEVLQAGRIYIAAPDYHLLVKKGYLSLSKGPKENGFRPAIDVLFRTTAKAYGQSVTAVILTGMLDDGCAGLLSVKARGGTVIVQDPEDALYGDMPRNAIKTGTVDYILPLSEIPARLMALSNEKKLSTNHPAQQDKNPDVAETGDAEDVYDLRKTSNLTCPECGGVLAEHGNGNVLHFRCRVGHAYSAESLIALQSDTLENTLWAALRASEENAELAHRMADLSLQTGITNVQQRFEEKAQTIEHHAEVLRSMLLEWQ